MYTGEPAARTVVVGGGGGRGERVWSEWGGGGGQTVPLTVSDETQI